MPTPTLHSPMRSNDLQSPYLTRSVGSVQTLNSPIGNFPSLIPEIDSLILNVLLNDSILNIYRDINFDSCVLCACTSNELSINGIDSIIYLEKSRDHIKTLHSQGYSHEQSYSHSTIYPQSQSIHNSCSCGFSAVVNLRLSHASGLFYEDEIEITGIKTDVKYRQSNDHLSVHLLELIERKECLSSPFDYFNHSNILKKSTQDFLQISKQPFYQCKLENNFELKR
jgi:mediator of RNA polymerase II transcription subunit 13